MYVLPTGHPPARGHDLAHPDRLGQDAVAEWSAERTTARIRLLLRHLADRNGDSPAISHLHQLRGTRGKSFPLSTFHFIRYTLQSPLFTLHWWCPDSSLLGYYFGSLATSFPRQTFPPTYQADQSGLTRPEKRHRISLLPSDMWQRIFRFSQVGENHSLIFFFSSLFLGQVLLNFLVVNRPLSSACVRVGLHFVAKIFGQPLPLPQPTAHCRQVPARGINIYGP